MCQILHVVDFLGSRPMETAPTSFEGFLRPTQSQSDFTWFSEPHECIQHLAVPGGHPSNYEPGATLLNFSDGAQTVERTPYSVWVTSYLFLIRNWTREYTFKALYACQYCQVGDLTLFLQRTCSISAYFVEREHTIASSIFVLFLVLLIQIRIERNELVIP